VPVTELLAELFACFEQYRILCAQRSGVFGTQQVNRAMSSRLQLALGIRKSRQQEWYHGRPVLVTRNDYGLRLSNGDIGLCLADEQGRWQLHFSHLAEPSSRSTYGQRPKCCAMRCHGVPCGRQG